MEGKHQSPGDAIRIFTQLSAGGTALGLAVGVIATLWLRTMFENPAAEVRAVATTI